MSSTRCTNNPEVNTSTITRDCDENITAPDRRDFLKKLGKYAVVTPPVVASLMTHQKASASSQYGGYDAYSGRDDRYSSNYDRYGSNYDRYGRDNNCDDDKYRR